MGSSESGSSNDSGNKSKDNLTNTCCSSEFTAVQDSGLSQVNSELGEINIIQDDPQITNCQSSIAVAFSEQKGSTLASSSTQLQPLDAYVSGEKLLACPVYKEPPDSGSQEHLTDVPKTLESDMDQRDRMHDNLPRLLEQDDECTPGGTVSDTNQIKDENHQLVATPYVCSDLISKPFVDHASEQMKRSQIKVDHTRSGVLRRCLQFDECQQKSIKESPVSCIATENQPVVPDLSQSFSPETPSNKNVVDESAPVGAMRFSRALTHVYKPRGIGLHLNSIVASPSRDLVASVRSSKRMVKLEGKSLILPGSVETHTISSRNVEKISSISEANLHVIESVDIPTSEKMILPIRSKPSDVIVLQESGSDEQAESMEHSQPDPSSLRKQSTDGCKRCRCRKSKCLKLYCDCFAAGLYCAGSCSCRGCYNRPEHEDKVVEARRQIETRNPLAFAPRVMQHAIDSHTNSGESGEPAVQSSLRHKKGCNCRKSMCLKKYCECYQANVGCSDACRCEGCKNAYGKRPDYVHVHISNKRTIDEIEVETPDQKRKMLIISRSHVPVEDSPVAVPVTPALPCLDSRKKEMKPLLPCRRFVLSPDSEASPLSPPIRGGLVNLCEIARLPNPQIQDATKTKPKTLEYGDDDTPVILRDSPVPVKSVKVSSPNKKRISPPHNLINMLQPSLSGELRSSRKFVFRSISKFPSLGD